MQFSVMMQTSFDANLVRAKHSDIGVARALALFDCEEFFRLLVFQNFVHISKAAVFLHPMISNLMIAFPHHCDKKLFLDTAQKSILLFG